MRQECNSVVFIVDDNVHVRDGLKVLLESVGIKCETFKSTNDFLHRKHADEVGCLILDIRLPGTGGLDFQDQLVKANVETGGAGGQTKGRNRQVDAGHQGGGAQGRVTSHPAQKLPPLRK